MPPSNNKRGRPSKFSPELCAKIFILARRGLTEQEIAAILNISRESITKWKSDPDFLLSLKNNKNVADMIVKRSLFERAIGFTAPDVHITHYKGRIIKTPYMKYYPPDTMADMYWLNNRCPDEFRSRSDLHVTGELSILQKIRESERKHQGPKRNKKSS